MAEHMSNPPHTANQGEREMGLQGVSSCERLLLDKKKEKTIRYRLGNGR